MQKFKKGDIIIANQKIYSARVVGKKETAFEEIEISGLMEGTESVGSWSKYGGRSPLFLGSKESCKTGRCPRRDFNPKSGRVEEEATTGYYPVIGNHNLQTGSISIDIGHLAKFYPKLALKYANAAINTANKHLGTDEPQYSVSSAFRTSKMSMLEGIKPSEPRAMAGPLMPSQALKANPAPLGKTDFVGKTAAAKKKPAKKKPAKKTTKK